MVSFIIPVFNIPEECIARCIGSVWNQNCSDWEAILVDDGSTEQNASFCDECAKRDTRIRVIHQPNKGVSAARNAALDIVRGEWVVFLDADDCIHPELCSKIDHFLITEAEIVFFGYTIIRGAENYPSGLPVSTDRKELEKLVLDAKANESKEYAAGTVCGKAYARTLISQNGLRFNQRLKLAEDGLFALEAIQKSTRCVIVQEHLYYYICRPQSASAENSYRSDAAEQIQGTVKAFNLAFDSLVDKQELRIYYLNFQLFLCSTYMKQGPFHAEAGLSVAGRWRACKNSITEDIFWTIYDHNIARQAKLKQKVKVWLIRNRLYNTFWLIRKKS